jgi:DNA-binding transcriptional MerR regulator
MREGMEKTSFGTADVSYGIGEVEDVLDVKAHVIRYWEKEIPLIQPQKNKFNGRMRYSQKDIQLLLRLKYLLYRKKFTVDGAREQLYLELSGGSHEQKLRSEIASLRSDLLDIYFLNKRRGGV